MLCVGERYKRRGGSVPLVIGDDLHALVLEDAYARVSCPEVDSDGGHDFVVM